MERPFLSSGFFPPPLKRELASSFSLLDRRAGVGRARAAPFFPPQDVVLLEVPDYRKMQLFFEAVKLAPPPPS